MPRAAAALFFLSFAVPRVHSQTWRNVSLPTGVTLSTLFAGAPLGRGTRTLLFLHGFPEGAYTWWPVMASGAFPPSYTLVAPDQRGYNRSEGAGGAGDGALGVPLLAADVGALIDHLGGRVDLVAHDWGGGVAFWVAAGAPQRLSSLSIVNMAHPQGWIAGVRGVPAQQRASAYVLTFINPGFAGVLTANDCAELQGWFSGEAFWPSLKDALLSSWRVPGSVDRGLGWYRANIHPAAPLNCTSWTCWAQGVTGAFDSMPGNGTIAVPTLVQWGMLDTAVRGRSPPQFSFSRAQDA
jgi:pimeloyl-ACP methyl ester carboxylesterase